MFSMFSKNPYRLLFIILLFTLTLTRCSCDNSSGLLSDDDSDASANQDVGDDDDDDDDDDDNSSDGDLSNDGDFDIDDDVITDGGEDINDDGSYNYASALQKALYFYDAERCGDLPEDFRVSWRGDAHLCDYEVSLDTDATNLSSSFISDNEDYLDADGDGTMDLGGGFHDAGDHVKFGLPQNYTAATLGWALYEFQDEFEETNQYSEVMSILKWFSDYLLKSTFFDDDGDVVAFAYQVGDGDIDFALVDQLRVLHRAAGHHRHHGQAVGVFTDQGGNGLADRIESAALAGGSDTQFFCLRERRR